MSTITAPIARIVWLSWFVFQTVANRPLFGKKNLTLAKMLRFWAVGGVGFGINLAVLYTFTEVVGFWYIISAVVALFAAATSNFILNAIWTFKES